MYPQIDILRISIIFTDTDSNFFVCMDTDTKSRIFYRDTLRLFYFISVLLLFSIVNIRHSRHRHHGLQVIELSSIKGLGY